jgi:hypothetical protein
MAITNVASKPTSVPRWPALADWATGGFLVSGALMGLRYRAAS